MDPSPLPVSTLPNDPITDRSASAPSRSRLASAGLAVAHVVWVAIVVLDVFFFALGVPSYFLVARVPCESANPIATCLVGTFSVAGFQTFQRMGIAPAGVDAVSTATVVGLSLIFFVCGALIARHRWRDGIGLFASAVLITFGGTGISDAFLTAIPLAIPYTPWMVSLAAFGGIAQACANGLSVLQWPAFGAFLLTFPTGRFTPRWSWLLVGLWITNFLAFVLAPPWGVTLASLAITFGSVLVTQVYRYMRVYDNAQRQQTKWFVYALAFGISVLVITGLASTAFPAISVANAIVVSILNTLDAAVIFIPIAVAVAIALLRYRLYDIDLLINRTLVYAALTACVIGVYVLVVGYLGAALRVGANPVISLVAAGVVAILFQPLREWLQRAANRLMFGDRDNPYAVLARLDDQLAQALPAETALSAIVATVATALKLPYAAITLTTVDSQQADDSARARTGKRRPATVAMGESGKAASLAPTERVAAAYGDPAPIALRLPLIYGAETMGDLYLAPRAAEAGFTSADIRLLNDLAAHAGVVAHAVRLTADLRAARERLVTAREEERRRLRRDLHDGLGPQLASLILTLTAAREYLAHDVVVADGLLADLATHVQTAISDVRRLVYELRPPSLDDLGLVGALRDQAARYAVGGLEVVVKAPAALEPLPAAVEVAAYRVCLEALANVVHHAHARACLIALSRESGLSVEISDDGVGIAPDAVMGVGLRSMRERAEELGGACAVEPAPGGGTRISVRWPLAE